jgi:hypothetical protein
MPGPRGGGSPAFVDPELTAEQGHPVWLPETGAASLRLGATSFDGRTPDRRGLLIPALPNVEHILLDTAGRQHVFLRAGAVSLQLAIIGQDGITAPATLGLQLSRRHDIGALSEALAGLEALLSGRPAGAPPHWTAETERRRDALIAVDCDHAGLTLRATAVVIYGRQRVDRDWPGKGLKDRMRRNRQRGLALCSGGYRNLLR